MGIVGNESTVIVIVLLASHSLGYSILFQIVVILYHRSLCVHPHEIGLIVLHDVYRGAGKEMPAHDTPGRV